VQREIRARVSSEAGILPSLGSFAGVCLRVYERPFGCVPHSKLMMVVREARVKVGLFTGVHHVSFPFDNQFSFGQKARPISAQVRLPILCDARSAGGNSADVRTGSSVRSCHFVFFSPSYSVRLRNRVHRMRYPGETDTNATSVVAGCFNLYQMIPDVKETPRNRDVYSISQPFRFKLGFVDALFFFWTPFPADASIY